MIDQYNSSKNNHLRIPKKADSDTYKLEDLNEEQFTDSIYHSMQNKRMVRSSRVK
jgi:hypothetical protein